MKESQSIHDKFKIKIAIDTQILCYLIDNTYPSLNLFISKLLECDFVEIVCSRFAIYEFIGVRKLEHYLRAIHAETASKAGTMSFSSTLKYKNDWNAPELPYKVTFETITRNVEADLKRLDDEFGITYDGVQIHRKIWTPFQKLVLSSKISKEDALMLLTTVFPDEMLREEHLVFLTNDVQFYQSFKGDDKIDKIDEIFTNESLVQPYFYKIDNIGFTGKPNINLKQALTGDAITEFISQFITSNIAIKAKKFLLGNTLRCEARSEIAENLLCFKMVDGAQLPNNIYIVIIGKDLSFTYTHPVALSGFYSYGEITDYPYSPTLGNDNSYKVSVTFKNADGTPIEKELKDKITESGNFIFIHPDTEV